MSQPHISSWISIIWTMSMESSILICFHFMGVMMVINIHIMVIVMNV